MVLPHHQVKKWGMCWNYIFKKIFGYKQTSRFLLRSRHHNLFVSLAEHNLLALVTQLL